MSKRRIQQQGPQQRFEDLAHGPLPMDGASFFFDLKLMLPAGMTAPDVQRARQTVERRLQKTVRKKDRIVWTADGFFLVMATSHPARAGAAAERVHQDICDLLQSSLSSRTVAKPDAKHRGAASDPGPRRPGSAPQRVSPGSRVSLAPLDRPG